MKQKIHLEGYVRPVGEPTIHRCGVKGSVGGSAYFYTDATCINCLRSRRSQMAECAESARLDWMFLERERIRIDERILAVSKGEPE